jgi:hypothetical protein
MIDLVLEGHRSQKVEVSGTPELGLDRSGNPCPQFIPLAA